jgi:hypothetical protein
VDYLHFTRVHIPSFDWVNILKDEHFTKADRPRIENQPWVTLRNSFTPDLGPGFMQRESGGKLARSPASWTRTFHVNLCRHQDQSCHGDSVTTMKNTKKKNPPVNLYVSSFEFSRSSFPRRATISSQPILLPIESCENAKFISDCFHHSYIRNSTSLLNRTFEGRLLVTENLRKLNRHGIKSCDFARESFRWKRRKKLRKLNAR